MIQKRYQYMENSKIVWSDWYNYTDDDSQLKELQSQKWQLKNKYLQEFRLAKQ